jgi:hypothetical protein
MGNETSFKQGQSGNPKGRPKESPESKTVKHLSAVQFREAASRLIQGNLKDLKEAKEDRDEYEYMEWAIANFLWKAVKNGRYDLFDGILNRLIGKPKESIDLTSSDGSMSPKVSEDQLTRMAEVYVSRKRDVREEPSSE